MASRKAVRGQNAMQLYSNAHLAEVRAAFEIAIGVGRLREIKRAVDHGAHLRAVDCAIHRFEHLPRTHPDTPESTRS